MVVARCRDDKACQSREAVETSSRFCVSIGRMTRPGHSWPESEQPHPAVEPEEMLRTAAMTAQLQMGHHRRGWHRSEPEELEMEGEL